MDNVNRLESMYCLYKDWFFFFILLLYGWIIWNCLVIVFYYIFIIL